MSRPAKSPEPSSRPAKSHEHSSRPAKSHEPPKQGRPSAGARLGRLLAVIPYILDHQGARLAEVAARFGISESDLENDLSLIPYCGLPPYTPDRLIDCDVRDGRVFLRFAEYLSRPLQLTPAEGFSLLAAGRTLLCVPGADPNGSLASALGKLAGVLGDASGVAIDLGPNRFLEALRAAAEGGERLEIDYYSFNRDVTSTRQVEPHAVFAAATGWYVDAFCHQAGEDRMFRVDRVRDLRPTGGRFVPDPERRPDGPVFHPRPEDLRVTLLLAPEARWVAEAYPTEEVAEELDGRLLVVLAVAGEAFLERLLLRLGGTATVLGSVGAAEVGRRAATRLLSRYRPEDGGAGVRG